MRLVPERWYNSAHRTLEKLRKSMKETPSSLNCDFEEYSRLKEEQTWMFIYEKLHDLEDIEEELGIDLIKLIECIRNEKGIWKRENGDGKLINTRCMLTCEFGYWRVYDKETVYDLKDYGKTWALTKEELER